MQPKPESSAEEGATDAGANRPDAGASRGTFESGDIEGVVVRDLRKFVDARGWLAELFRDDEVDAEFRPAMAYISTTKPGARRGPHEHAEQADFFCFIGPSDFKLRLWDNRPDSQTFGHVMTLEVGDADPKSVIVPRGVVHAYENVGDREGVVINFPNRLYKGERRAEPVDEIRHEDDPETVFRLDD